jgi:hypothetical protein
MLILRALCLRRGGGRHGGSMLLVFRHRRNARQFLLHWFWPRRPWALGFQLRHASLQPVDPLQKHLDRLLLRRRRSGRLLRTQIRRIQGKSQD